MVPGADVRRAFEVLQDGVDATETPSSTLPWPFPQPIRYRAEDHPGGRGNHCYTVLRPKRLYRSATPEIPRRPEKGVPKGLKLRVKEPINVIG
eukprot:3419013-Amphidinium_carterae.1